MGSGSNQKGAATRCISGSHKKGVPRKSGRHKKGADRGIRKEETKKRADRATKAREQVQATVDSMRERIRELEKHLSWEQSRRIALEADVAKYRARYLAARGARLPPGSDLLL